MRPLYLTDYLIRSIHTFPAPARPVKEGRMRPRCPALETTLNLDGSGRQGEERTDGQCPYLLHTSSAARKKCQDTSINLSLFTRWNPFVVFVKRSSSAARYCQHMLPCRRFYLRRGAFIGIQRTHRAKLGIITC